MDYETKIKQLADKKEMYAVTYRQLQAVTGVSYKNLGKILSGKRKAGDRMLNKIETALERLNPNAPLEIIFDYVRIRFPTDDVEHILRDILKINPKYMIHEEHAFYGYSEQYILGDIVVMADTLDLEKGVLLELKGKGCRQFESCLLAQDRSWYDFFKPILDHENAVFKRIDIAINDRAGLLDIPFLASKCEAGECISMFRAFRYYASGELKKRDEKIGMGNTLYIGSLQSDIYFCIYEKDMEQYIKRGLDVKESDVKNRFEIRLKNDRAYLAINDILCYRNPFQTAFSIINRYIRFADWQEDVDRRNWKTNEIWKMFIGDEGTDIRLTMKPEPYTLEKTKNWIARQVAPSLKLLLTLDEIHGVDEIEEIINNAKLTDKQKKLLEQQTEVANQNIITE